MSSLWIFVLSVALYTGLPLAYSVGSGSYRFLLLYVHLATVLVIGGLLGAVYLLPVVGATILAGQVTYAAFVFTAVITLIAARDAQALRNVAVLSVAVNVLVYGILRISAVALTNRAVPNPGLVPVEMFQTSLRGVLVGGLLILAELGALLVMFEAAKRRRLARGLMIAVYLAGFTCVLAADGVLFPLLILAPTDATRALIVAGVHTKLILAVVFDVPLLAFLVVSRSTVDRFEATPISPRQLITPTHEPLFERLHRSERAARRWESTVKTILDAAENTVLVTTDADFRITRFNRGAVSLLGFTEREVLGRTPDFFQDPPSGDADQPVSDDERAALISTWRSAADGMQRDATYRTKTGAEVVVSLSINEVHEGNTLVGYLAAGEDVTRRVKSERALSEALEQAEEAGQRLREADQLKDVLVSTVSHELRTPVTSIQGYVEVMAEGLLGDIVPEQADALARVARNVARLQALIDDLLFDARSAGAASPETQPPIDLRAAVTQAWATSRQLASTRDLDLSCVVPEHPVWCCGDLLALERLVLNLVGNAVKFTPDGGRVEVTLQADGAGARLQVRDTGIGIPAADLPLSFDRFHRSAQARKAQIAGSGLGLGVVRDVATQHGGTVALDSDGEHGTTATVWLPMTDAGHLQDALD